MPRKLRDEIRYCHKRARECLRKAQECVLPEQRQAFAQIANNWMNLAQSYEFTERLIDFTNEHQRPSVDDQLH